MNIGIIGAGEMGSLLAEKFVGLGHKVSIANSRSPDTIKDVETRTGARAVFAEQAITDQEIIIIALPQKNIPLLPIYLFSQLAAGVAVIETGNYYPSLRDGIIPELVAEGIDSLWVQQQLGYPVVKAFNAILATSIEQKSQPDLSANRIAIPVASDDANAKRITFDLIDSLGFDAFDTGGIMDSWKQQPGSAIYCRDITLAQMQKRVDAMDNSWERMRTSILMKRKADEKLMKEDYPAYLKQLI